MSYVKPRTKAEIRASSFNHAPSTSLSTMIDPTSHHLDSLASFAARSMRDSMQQGGMGGMGGMGMGGMGMGGMGMMNPMMVSARSRSSEALWERRRV